MFASPLYFLGRLNPFQITRAELIIFAATAFILATPSATPAADAGAVALSARTVPGGTSQLKMVVEVAGDLKLNADGKEVRRVPVSVEANLRLCERQHKTASDAAPRTLRQYGKCEARIRIQDKEFTHQLRGDRQLLDCQVQADHVVLYSPAGPLTREELDLVESPFQTLLLPRLLPTKPVELGESWTVPEGILQAALNLDAINQQQVTATFKDIKDNVALIEFAGRVSGAAEGVSSDIDFKAKLNLDVKRQLITWFALSLREHRAVGHARPGFETVTKLRLLAEPCETPPELTDKAIAALPKPTPANQLIELTSGQSGYAFLHDRRWRRMTDRHDVAVLRMVDQGDLIAQCNISKLPALPKGQQLTLEGFQQDIARGLGSSLEQMVEASQQPSDDKSLVVLRVVAVGKVQDIPIQWIHYNVADAQGHRASLVFTLEQKYAERFAGTDRSLVPSFHFTATPEVETQTSQKAGETKR